MAVMSLQPRNQPGSGSLGARIGRNGFTIMIVDITFLILATAAVVLRFAARRMKRTQFLVEDYIILAALVRSESQLLWVPISHYHAGVSSSSVVQAQIGEISNLKGSPTMIKTVSDSG